MDKILDSANIDGAEYELVDRELRNSCDSTERYVADLLAYLNLPVLTNVLGIQIDFKNKRFTRLANAEGLNPGDDFNGFSMYNRRRCNVANDGTITAWYGDSNYREDGSNGQVMVYQPKFYYLALPIEKEPIRSGKGYHLRCCNYYITDTELPGFKLHPAFKDKNGNEVDYIFESAYEGCVFDSSLSSYILDDSQIIYEEDDLLCSVANAKPVSGLSQELTRENANKMANNRGDGWYSATIKTESACQLLMAIEYGCLGFQEVLGRGVVDFNDDNDINCSSLTGSTSNLGNNSGRASSTINERGGLTTTYTEDGKTSISYRGKENPYGNINKFVEGINVVGDGNNWGGLPYICSDLNFIEGKSDENYVSAEFTISNKSGFISAFGYGNKEFDWLFLPSETDGDSISPVGDYGKVVENLSGNAIMAIGGDWKSELNSGEFNIDLSNTASKAKGNR